MPRFSVPFGRRRSTADNVENVPAEPSFRVLDRSEVGNGKSFDGGARLTARAQTMPKTIVQELSEKEDNIFADLKTNNRGSGSSNTTKTTFTDNSSRHSNASTAPSSNTDYSSAHDESRAPIKKPYADIPVPPVPKSSSSGFLKAAGRTFSFGGQKKSLPPVPVLEEEPSLGSATPPQAQSPEQPRSVGGRSRATTSSTTSTATPPKLEQDFDLDLGGDFSKMLSFDKRQSVATLKEEHHSRQALGPRSLTGNRLNQPSPSPIQIDKSSRIDPSPLSWNSQHSAEQLLQPSPTKENDPPPPVPRHSSPLAGKSQGTPATLSADPKHASPSYGRRVTAEAEDEDTSLLKDISAATRFLSDGTSQSAGRYRRNENTLGAGYRQFSSESRSNRFDNKDDDSPLFDTNLVNSSKLASRYVSRRPSPPRNKVMTPAQFERYRQDKERQGSDSDDDAKPKDAADEDNYEDDEDEIEKSKQVAKQRKKQEAHMAVYRQQMMKVTGEAATGLPSRPSMSISFSSPNLLNQGGPSPPNGTSDGSDDDEEVPLAILAAHGFPAKNRPPTRLSTMMSNPNLRAVAQTPSYQRPSSVVGDVPGPASAAPTAGNNGRLPVFARNLPKDPYVGAGLVNTAVREGLSYGGGAPAPSLAPPGIHPGGLVGVIASEERSRAMRRGSPALDGHKPMLSIDKPSGFDPLARVPSQMMYPNAPPPGMLSTADQAQLQMNQQMQQFMQMQMQFMQMMANNNNRNSMSSSIGGSGMGGMMGMGGPETMRHSFIDNGSVLDLPRPESHMRTMSMVQPSSTSWIQTSLPRSNYAPSIRVQGVAGYAPSIAPSERSNIGLPGRYRPVSHVPAAPKPIQSPSPISPGGSAADGDHMRKSSTMSGALGAWDQTRKQSPLQNTSTNAEDDEDDEKGWAAMKQKREKKRSLWKTKKTFGSDIGALIS